MCGGARSVPLVSLVISVPYSVIFLTQSQSLRFYENLDINKTCFFFFACKITPGLLHLPVCIRESVYQVLHAVATATKDLLGLGWGGVEPTGQGEELAIFLRLSFPIPYLTPHTQIDPGWAVHLNVKGRTRKLPEAYRWDNLYTLG